MNKKLVTLAGYLNRANLKLESTQVIKLAQEIEEVGNIKSDLKEQITEVAEGICSTHSFLNCRLFVQLVSHEPKLESIPTISGEPQVGDIIQWGEDPARHWAIFIGNGEVLEVPEWGGGLGTQKIQELIEEYDHPNAIRRPSWEHLTSPISKHAMYTDEKVERLTPPHLKVWGEYYKYETKSEKPTVEQMQARFTEQELFEHDVLQEAGRNPLPTVSRSLSGAEEWKLMGEYHREDGPAVTWLDGSKWWYINGKPHREDGPAVTRANGERRWYVDGKLHRDGGPAIILEQGHEFWYQNDELHREDGPAVEHRHSPGKQWYWRGKLMSEAEWKGIAHSDWKDFDDSYDDRMWGEGIQVDRNN